MRLLILLVLGFSLNGVFGALPPTLPPGVTNSQNPKDKPISPQEALKKVTLPEGFRATLFAGEPDVMQPIAFDFDDRGRLWVVECFGYPDFKREDSDRILIFEDRNGDGVFDTRTVFLTNGHHLSGIAIGFGGVWLTSTPNLIFIPDRDGNDVPDGKPEVLLDGWTLKAQHNMVNGLSWGPDGWLYGRHGITAPSLVGKPGTPDAQRTRVSCGIWRFHPARRIFEVVVNGTTNPWGLDWDDFGQPFFSNNVIGHFWHAVPGAHYKRMFGEDFNPHVYQLMDQTADHLHWAGGDWTKGGRSATAGELGGGHSHAGCMVYLGGAWPSEYRNRVFMANIHGNRVLYDELQRQGSGYVARHGTSGFMIANDAWFRGVSIHYGPDGGVFVSDWNDLGECHDNDGAYRMSGRIYKITYGQPKPVAPFDLQKLSDLELVKLQLHTNDWYVRHARRILEERAFGGRLTGETAAELQKILRENPDVTRRLRALWTLHAIGRSRDLTLMRRAAPERRLQANQVSRPMSLLSELLGDRDQNMRWWAVQLLVEDRDVSNDDLQAFALMARNDPSPAVRLALASALQRLPVQKRWAVAHELLQHADDAADQNLPLMLWYAIEPMVPVDNARALQLARVSQIPLVREFIARRIAEATP